MKILLMQCCTAISAMTPVVIKLPIIVCRKALTNTAELVVSRLWSSRPRSSHLSDVYHRFGCNVNSKIPLSILPHPYPNFYQVKKYEIWPRSSTLLVFEPLSFKNEVTYLHQSMMFGAAMMELCSLQTWCSKVHPPVRRGNLPPWKKLLNCR